MMRSKNKTFYRNCFLVGATLAVAQYNAQCVGRPQGSPLRNTRTTIQNKTFYRNFIACLKSSAFSPYQMALE